MTNFSITDAINKIEFLPHLILESINIDFDTPTEKKIISLYKQRYKGLSLWLRHLVLKEGLVPEAKFSDLKHFRASAELNNAFLDLIVGLHSREAILQKFYDSPVKLWFDSLWIDCNHVLSNSGLLGKTSIYGKNDFYLFNKLLLNTMDERVITPSAMIDFEESPETYLSMLASNRIDYDSDFLNGYWIPFTKKKHYWERKIRDNKHLQLVGRLPNDQLFITGDKAKIPKAIKYGL